VEHYVDILAGLLKNNLRSFRNLIHQNMNRKERKAIRKAAQSLCDSWRFLCALCG
jgi:hypothetical protein